MTERDGWAEAAEERDIATEKNPAMHKIQARNRSRPRSEGIGVRDRRPHAKGVLELKPVFTEKLTALHTGKASTMHVEVLSLHDLDENDYIMQSKNSLNKSSNGDPGGNFGSSIPLRPSIT